MNAGRCAVYIRIVMASMAFKSSSQALGIPLSLFRLCAIHGTNFLFCGMRERHSSTQAVENALHRYLSIIARDAR